MGNESKDKDREDTEFGKYMRELYRLPSGKLPSHVAVCRDAKIDRSFYNRVKNNGFQGGVPEPKNVSALCNAIVLKESLKKPITAQEVLDGLINAGILPKGSLLEPEKEDQEVALQTVNATNVIQEDKKVKNDEAVRLVAEEMQDNMNALNVLARAEETAKNKKSSQDYGTWK